MEHKNKSIAKFVLVVDPENGINENQLVDFVQCKSCKEIDYQISKPTKYKAIYPTKRRPGIDLTTLDGLQNDILRAITPEARLRLREEIELLHDSDTQDNTRNI